MLQIEKLQKDKLESQIMLDMYGQEGHDPRYVDLSILFYKNTRRRREKQFVKSCVYERP